MLLRTHAGPEENFVYHGEEGRLTRCDVVETTSRLLGAQKLKRVVVYRVAGSFEDVDVV